MTFHTFQLTFLYWELHLEALVLDELMIMMILPGFKVIS